LIPGLGELLWRIAIADHQRNNQPDDNQESDSHDDDPRDRGTILLRGGSGLGCGLVRGFGYRCLNGCVASLKTLLGFFFFIPDIFHFHSEAGFCFLGLIQSGKITNIIS
jgi:hypothetical protein